MSTFYVASEFQCGQGCFNTGFQLMRLSIPSCPTGQFQCRACQPGASFGVIFDGLPNLLNFTHAQFRLIQKKEVFIEIIFIKENVTFSRERRITPSSSRFLYIVFKRRGDVIVDDKADIFFIHPHAEGIGGHHDSDLIA